MNFTHDKKFLRVNYLRKRLAMPFEQVEEKSELVCSNFIKTGIVENYTNFLIYLPIKNEVETKLIIKKVRSIGKNIFVPAFYKNKWVIARLDDKLLFGSYGILQPEKISAVAVELIECAIFPGVVFSRNGYRIGYGLGVFDKLFATSKAFKVGLGYEFQIVSDFKNDDYDLRLNMLITDKQCYSFYN